MSFAECQQAINGLQVAATLIIGFLILGALILMADSVRSVSEKDDDK